MSKSTPLVNLPNVKNNSTAYEEKENELVKEILQEIDGNESEAQQQPQQQQQHQQHQQHQQQQHQQQQMAEQQMAEQQIAEQEMAEKEMAQQQMAQHQMTQQQMAEDDNETIINKIIRMAKQPLIVALVAIVISIPNLSAGLEEFIKTKAALVSYSAIIILLIKGILAGGLYFGINKSM